MPRFVSHRVEAKRHRGYELGHSAESALYSSPLLGDFLPPSDCPPGPYSLTTSFPTLYPFLQTSPSRVVPSLNCFIWAFALTFTLVRRGNGLHSTHGNQKFPSHSHNRYLPALEYWYDKISPSTLRHLYRISNSHSRLNTLLTFPGYSSI